MDTINAARGRTWGAHYSEVESEYFKVRIYKNGNMHIWFQRRDLLEKVNKLLAEYYGEVVGDSRQTEDDGLRKVKTTPAKHFGFYPTPEPLCEEVLHRFPLLQRAEEPLLTILEPSAGTGNLARACLEASSSADVSVYSRDKYHARGAIDCVEIQPHLAAQLKAEGLWRRVYHADFLLLRPETTGLYDRVVMNPPFDLERDIDHVMHALDFLKPSGMLLAIMSAGTEFRGTKKSTAFRALMEKMGARWKDLPAGSFASVGTYVNTVLLTVRKDGRPFY